MQQQVALLQSQHPRIHIKTEKPAARKQPKKPKPCPPSGFYGVTANKNGKPWKAQRRHQAGLAYDRKARQCEEDKPLNYEGIRGGGSSITGPLYCNSPFGVYFIFLSFFSRPLIRGGYNLVSDLNGFDYLTQRTSTDPGSTLVCQLAHQEARGF
jgi:hypothetical protein